VFTIAGRESDWGKEVTAEIMSMRSQPSNMVEMMKLQLLRLANAYNSHPLMDSKAFVTNTLEFFQ
jgi:hypothetical protein